MAWLFADSFDFYSSTSTNTFMADAATHWDTAATGISALVTSANTRFTTGQAVQIGQGTVAAVLVKSSGSNDAGHHLVFAYKNSGVTTAGNALTFTLLDGTTAQCSVVFDPSGTIYLKSGLGGGTVLATYAAGLSLGVWYGIEIEVVINGTTGSFKVRLNGNTSDDFSATGLNTKPGTNAYANKVQIGSTAAVTSSAQQIDDFLWFSTSGAAPNTWVGDIRAQQLMPTSDGTVGFTPTIGSTNSTPPGSVSVSSTTFSTGTLVTSSAITPVYAGSVTSLSIALAASFTGHYALGLYDGSTGVPTTLLGQTAVQTNATSATQTINLIAPVTFAAGAKFFVALLADATVTAFLTGTSNIRGTQTVAYASGLPSSFAGTTSSTTTMPWMTLNSTANNASQVAQSTEDGDTSFVYGSTASVGDLYDIADLTVTPSSIVAVQTRMCARKSDTGTRTARVQVKSGATTSNGSTVTLGTSYSYTGAKVDTVDPNTSATWTAAAINALQIGPYVVA